MRKMYVFKAKNVEDCNACIYLFTASSLPFESRLTTIPPFACSSVDNLLVSPLEPTPLSLLIEEISRISLAPRKCLRTGTFEER